MFRNTVADMSTGHPHSIPSRRHKASGQAVVTLTDGLVGRRDVLLGHYKTKTLKIEFSRVIAESLANGRQRATVGSVP
jgi:hypothetical protein